MRFLRIFLGVIAMMLVIGGVFAWRTWLLPTHTLQSKIDASKTSVGVVLGAVQYQASSAEETIGRFSKPVTDAVEQTIGKTISQVSTDANGNKIPVDKAVEQVKEQAAAIPQNVIEKVRYDYCKQVVEEYQKKE